MDPLKDFLMDLKDAAFHNASFVGGKSKNLSLCGRAGFKVPEGLCLTTAAYHAFVTENSLDRRLDILLNRRPLENLRWEELWDIGLRIRADFQRNALPDVIQDQLTAALSQWPKNTLFSVRSSSMEEDTATYSFAGIHESFVHVPLPEISEKVKLVWASLWNDRSLLYRKEKRLDTRQSAMAVLIQPMVLKPVSGIAFTVNPVSKSTTEIVVEAVEGTLDLLVDNIKEPDKLVFEKSTGKTTHAHLPNLFNYFTENTTNNLFQNIRSLESLFNMAVDIEWTGLDEEFTLLQIRPVTTGVNDQDHERDWYLSLSPGVNRLMALSEKVEGKLIPELKKDIQRFQSWDPVMLKDELFLKSLREIAESYKKWKDTYWADFIPFAHGIRSFAVYYNDLMKPDNPYEFIDLLANQTLLAKQRDEMLEGLTYYIKKNPKIKELLETYVSSDHKENDSFEELLKAEGICDEEFQSAFQLVLNRHFDIYYDNFSLHREEKMLLSLVLSLANLDKPVQKNNSHLKELEKDFLKKAGKERKDEAATWLRIGRLSWKLRDDDNILLGKIEHQLYLWMMDGGKRLLDKDLLHILPRNILLEEWSLIYEGLAQNKQIQLTETKPKKRSNETGLVKARQLIGQPASPGVVTGRARVIHSIEEFQNVVSGEILVFDAIQPQMTFIVSLASALIERRGGMLVHSSIIAREMKIPAVNGVHRASELIRTGDLVTVNGDFGLVVIGEPEFNLEKNT